MHPYARVPQLRGAHGPLGLAAGARGRARRASPCFMCAETAWQRCHRRFIAELLVARGHEVVHLIRPHELERHRLGEESEARGGKLYLCGVLVA